MKLGVRPFLEDETGEECAKRLLAEGYTLENIGELAAFMLQHPAEVDRWMWVVALGEACRWTDPSGRDNVPCARAASSRRCFGLSRFLTNFCSDYGVLVSRK